MSKDFVVKLAQPGFDVKTAGDENLIYSSKWPLLKIYKQGSFTITNFRQSQVITTHDLGYAPFFWWFANEAIEGWQGTTVTPANRSEFHGNLGGGGSLAIDNNKLVFNPAGASFTNGSLVIYYYIFTLPLAENYTAPQIKTGGLSSNFSSKQVFKLAKLTKNTSSPNLEDYVIHSDARSPLIHSVTLGTLKDLSGPLNNVPTINIYHNLGYIPMFFGFFNNEDGSYNLMYGTSPVAGVIGFIADTQKLSFAYPTSQPVSIVILKDPYLVSYSIQVNI